MAFELDRVILRTVFPEQRLYGFQVANIKDKIKQVATCSQTGKVNEELRFEMMNRYYHLMDQLKKFGYDRKVHPYFTEYLVNTYGIMKDKMAIEPEDLSMNDPQFLRKMITECMYTDKVKDILIILDCLVYLAKKDGSSIFIQ
ncbi:hypothetical protein GDO78_019589 [Eleutherodactylus coqui]|uniref:Speriolin C-terminal domain-containing protein n=1 Tax=Eleutherodactylus coqui TaxID=57060 RepID=A0A8J6JU27_ELECQ|nr:hypothetical protein GDO78_019589 [Eleutherodactylus coqui]